MNNSIAAYRYSEEDAAIYNPYLEEIMGLIRAGGDRDSSSVISPLLGRHRSDLIVRYAFSVPTADVLGLVARYSPLVEIGAGNGYWAMCLRGLGADIVAYDIHPPGEGSPWDPVGGNRWFEDAWFNVVEGDASMAGRYPDRSLFLCWPPIHDPMAAEALRSYREGGGSLLVFIGSRESSADEAFYRDLSSGRIMERRPLWSWPGIDEELFIVDVSIK